MADKVFQGLEVLRMAGTLITNVTVPYKAVFFQRLNNPLACAGLLTGWVDVFNS